MTRNSSSIDSGLSAASALWTRTTGDAAPAAATRDEWLEQLAGDLAPRTALTLAEHLFGALPLLDTCLGPEADGDELVAALRRGEQSAGLGFFTPHPEHSWSGAAVVGRRSEGELILGGEVRLTAMAEASLVLVDLADAAQPRLALVDHAGAGATLSARRDNKVPPAAGKPCWLRLHGVRVPAARVSPRVDLDPVTGVAGSCLDDHAGIYARLVAAHARRGVQVLRRGLRTTVHGEAAWKSAQLPGFRLTELEIELDLLETAVKIADEAKNAATTDAVQEARPTGLELAASAARVLDLVVGCTAKLEMEAGLTTDGPFAEAADLQVFLGGAWTIERELARTLGL